MRRTAINPAAAITVLLTLSLALAACSASANPSGGGTLPSPTAAAVGSPATGGASPAASEAGSGGGQSSDSAVGVEITNFAFSPASITVKVGTTVTWTNMDSARHTVTADDGSFDSGGFAQGGTFSWTFTKAGTYPYHCTFHASMTGWVTVTP